MNAAVDPDSSIGQAARTWALAVAGEDFPPERSNQFRAWLDADPLHRPAYEEAEAVILMLGELRLDAIAPTPAARTFRRPTTRWRAPAFAATGLLAACLAIAVFARPAPSYETGPGETRQIALSDGSQITLAPASRLRAISPWRARDLSLDQGEAFFVVAKQDGHPFTVQAGDALVRVVGTRFNVHRGADRAVRVEVEQGVVQVSDRPNGQGRMVTVRAGQTAIAGPRGVSAGLLPAGDQAGGWRQGRLAYEEASLAEVVADLNRYGRRLTIGSAAVGQMKITAAFEIAQADRFVAELPRALPVRLSPDGRGGLVIVTETKRPPERHAP